MTVIEIAEFSLAHGVEEGAFLATRPAVEDFLRRREGFLSLRLARQGNRWMDVAEWRDRAAAEAAPLPAEPALAPFLATLDPHTLPMHHPEVVDRL